MASKAVASAPAFIGKLLRHRLHPLSTAPFAPAGQRFCTAPPPPGSPDHHKYEPNPFLRTGEAGPCRVERTEKECYMRIDVPGVAEEDMKVWSETGFIYFYAKDSKLPNYNYDGRVFGGSISFNPDHFDSDRVKAEVKNGVLWLAVPRVNKDDDS